MPPETTWISVYGPWGAFALYFLVQRLWPFIEKRVYPDLAGARKAAATEQREWEERLLRALENNTAALVTLQVTNATANEADKQMAAAMREIADDLADLRTQLNQPRHRKTVKEKVDVS